MKVPALSQHLSSNRSDLQEQATELLVHIESASKKRLDAPSKTRKRALLVIVSLAVLVGAFVLSNRLWRQTVLHEAYLPELEEMAKREASDGKLQAALALRQAQSNDYFSAAESLHKAIEDGESNEATWLTWSASLAAAGDRKQAAAVLLLGKRDSRLVNVMDAAILRGRAVGLTPTPSALAEAICPEGASKKLAIYASGSVFNKMFEMWGRQNPEKSGFSTREQWAKENPKNLLAMRLLGEALARNRRLPEAIEVLQSVVKSDSTSAEARLALGQAFEEAGVPAQAGVQYSAALKIKPDWFPALMGLGSIAVKKDLIMIAVGAYEKAYKQRPDSVEAVIGLGKAYYNQRTALSKSLEMFEKAAKLAPARTDFYTYYSNALRNNFKMDEAETVLKRRLQEVPNDARAHYLIGLLLLDNHPTPSRETEAERELRTALKLEPDVITTKVRLGRLLVARGNPREATPLLESSISEDRFNGPALFALQQAYLKTGRVAEAKRAQEIAEDSDKYVQRTSFLEDMLQRQPGDLPMHEELVKLYKRGNETEKAKSHADMAFMLKTHRKEAEIGIKKLNDATTIAPGRQ